MTPDDPNFAITFNYEFLDDSYIKKPNRTGDIMVVIIQIIIRNYIAV